MKLNDSCVLDWLESKYGSTRIGNERYVHLSPARKDGKVYVVEAVKANDVARLISVKNEVARVPVYSLRLSDAIGTANWEKLMRDVRNGCYEL